MVYYRGSRCARTCMLIYTVLFWISGFTLFFIGLWMILDPRRSYILDLVDFSEDDPLLRFAAYTCIVVGSISLVVAFFACCGSIKGEKCLLSTFLIFVFFIFCAEIAIGLLGIFYREKFTGDRMEVYIANMSHNRYYRDKWVTPLMDTIQYYITNYKYQEHLKSLIHHDYGISMDETKNQKVTKLIDKMQFYLKCCGSESPFDWQLSHWRASVPIDFLAIDAGEQWIHFTKSNANKNKKNETFSFPNVPYSCCVQMPGSTIQNLIAKSIIRCQQSGSASRAWRHQMQQCCGGKGPWDYYNSFWYITNTERGTRSYVPSSCCRQTQNARAWSLQPIDPLCTIYYYDTQAHNTSVNTEGCHERLQNWFEENSWIFIILGSSCAALQIIGMFISMVLIRQISSYQYLY